MTDLHEKTYLWVITFHEQGEVRSPRISFAGKKKWPLSERIRQAAPSDAADEVQRICDTIRKECFNNIKSSNLNEFEKFHLIETNLKIIKKIIMIYLDLMNQRPLEEDPPG